MKAIVICEESQEVTKALRAKGITAYSCDLQTCSGGHPEWHIQDDAIKVVYSNQWDLMIAHPPCTFITNAGVRWLFKDGRRDEDRWNELREGSWFFKTLLNAPIKYKAIENPIPHKYALDIIGRKYDQIIHPYQFGHTETKATCLWIENLPKLMPTNNVKQEMDLLPKNLKNRIHYMSPGPERTKLRSKTYTGIAEAIADQWGNHVMNQLLKHQENQ
ncbi:MAG: hypothetical protein RIC03_06845 [Cyclobacteriaceae bacterium]